MKVKNLTIVFLIIISCSGSRQLAHYSRDNVEQGAISSLYENIPVMSEPEDIKRFIVKMDLSQEMNVEIPYVDKCFYQPLIDMEGKIEAVFISGSVNTLVDSIMIENIKNSTFKTYKSVMNEDSKYSLLLPFQIFQGKAVPLFDDEIGSLSIPDDRKPPAPIGGFEAVQRNIKYPKAARVSSTEGKVVVNIKIDINGNVAETVILKSAGIALDQAAIDAVKSVKWSPAVKDNLYIESWIGVPILFRLNGSKVLIKDYPINDNKH